MKPKPVSIRKVIHPRARKVLNLYREGLSTWQIMVETGFKESEVLRHLKEATKP